MIKDEKMEKLPEGWKRVSIEKDTILISGLRPKGGALDEGIPSLGGEHITLDGRINFSDENAKYVPEKFFKIIPKGRVEVNDILINKDGANTGKVAILKEKIYPDMAINEHIFILRSKGFFDQRYLFYWIFSYLGQKQIKDRITGSAQPGLSSKFIKDFFVLKPPFPEQQKIAEILETVDNVIEKTDAIIEKYKRIKQGLMQDLLTRGIIENYELGIMNYGSELRKHESGIMNNELGVGSHESEIGNWELRDERKHKFKDSPLGKIPEEWEVVSLGEVALPNGIVRGPFGGMLKKEIFVSRGYKVYEQGNAIYKSVNLGHYSIDAKKYKQMLRFAVKPKDFIISCSGTIGKIFMIPDNFKKGIINQALLKITIDNKKFNHKFFEYFFEWERFQDKIIDYTQGGAMPNLIGINEFKKVSFPKPPLPEQRRIASILSQVDEVIEKEQKYKEKLERIKWGLMEDLLTGRIRVNSLIEHGYIENGK